MNLDQHQHPSKPYMTVQNFYYMPLLHLLGFQWVFGGLYDLLTLTYKGEKLPNSYVKERNVSLAFRAFFYVRRISMCCGTLANAVAMPMPDPVHPIAAGDFISSFGCFLFI
jgi:hypothetical protein